MAIDEIERWVEIQFFQPGGIGGNLEEALDEALEVAGFPDADGPAGGAFNDDGSFYSETLYYMIEDFDAAVPVLRRVLREHRVPADTCIVCCERAQSGMARSKVCAVDEDECAAWNRPAEDLTAPARREPPPGSPFERANWIRSTSTHATADEGRRIEALLLEGRTLVELSAAELRLLALGYNWCSEDNLAFDAARMAQQREPSHADGLILTRSLLGKACSGKFEMMLSCCDRCLRDGIEPLRNWHLLKAIAYQAGSFGQEVVIFLTPPSTEVADANEDGDDDDNWDGWETGLKGQHPQMLDLAVTEIETALKHDPEVRESSVALIGEWKERFGPILHDHRYHHLAK